jgi:hypothetical protein
VGNTMQGGGGGGFGLGLDEPWLDSSRVVSVST